MEMEKQYISILLMSLGPGMTDSVPPWWRLMCLGHCHFEKLRYLTGFLRSSSTPRAGTLSHRVLHTAVDIHSCKQEQEMHT